MGFEGLDGGFWEFWREFGEFFGILRVVFMFFGGELIICLQIIYDFYIM